MFNVSERIAGCYAVCGGRVHGAADGKSEKVQTALQEVHVGRTGRAFRHVPVKVCACAGSECVNNGTDSIEIPKAGTKGISQILTEQKCRCAIPVASIDGLMPPPRCNGQEP